MRDADRDRLTAALVDATDAIEVLSDLRDELADLGRLAAGRLHASGGSYAEAAWDAMPEGTRIGGSVWTALEAGFRSEWKRLEGGAKVTQ